MARIRLSVCRLYFTVTILPDNLAHRATTNIDDNRAVLDISLAFAMELILASDSIKRFRNCHP